MTGACRRAYLLFGPHALLSSNLFAARSCSYCFPQPPNSNPPPTAQTPNATTGSIPLKFPRSHRTSLSSRTARIGANRLLPSMPKESRYGGFVGHRERESVIVVYFFSLYAIIFSTIVGDAYVCVYVGGTSIVFMAPDYVICLSCNCVTYVFERCSCRTFSTSRVFFRYLDPALSLVRHNWITPHAVQVATLANFYLTVVLPYA